MPLSVWTQPSGFKFTNNGQPFTAGVSIDLTLPLNTSISGVSLRLISGELPSGLFLIGTHIIGSPFIKKNRTDYSFCIRASKSGEISDRTYKLSLTEPNVPTFITNPGELDIGLHRQYYVLDGSYVNYQLEAIDLADDRQPLSYFISSGDGQLPPGLTLSKDGVISGYIIPVLTILPNDGDGNYDGSIYDAIAFDFGPRPSNGFDNYAYDDVFFDFAVPTQQAISLNANYQFRVTITDGVVATQRLFRIFVVGNDQFRADNTATTGLASTFTADATYIRQPVWISKSDLGLFRANNYLTIPLALYDENTVSFRVETTNQEIYATSIQVTSQDNIVGSHSVTIQNATAVPVVGQYFDLLHYVPGATGEVYQISAVTSLGNNRYRLTIYNGLAISIPNTSVIYIGSLSKLPQGTTFDNQTGDVFGVVPYQPAITKNYKFTITSTRYGDKTDSVSASKTFSINILGDITSEIVWITDNDLGELPANYVSTLNVTAYSNVTGSVVIYQLTGGTLPPGLTLNPDGELIGKVNQYYKSATQAAGLITFDGGTTTFDNKTTSIERIFKFKITASDQYGYTATEREFTVLVTTPNTVLYSNITTRPFLNTTQRTLWKNFINNTDVFTPTSIYRTNDPVFGIQSSLSMLVYAGIETKEAAAYIGAMGLNHKRKRFQFGAVKKAIAVDPDTNETLYEVVYVEMLDPSEPDKKFLPSRIETVTDKRTITIDTSNSIWSRSLSDLNADGLNAQRPEQNITADSTGYEASNPNVDTYFPSSITNWQKRLKDVGLSERNYLPLWMRSIPEGSKKQLGYTLAVPLCFCKPGTADTILLNIKFSDFDFKDIDYTVDRYIIDSVTGQDSDKYLVFRNDRITV
jgi:hypothetical protein